MNSAVISHEDVIWLEISALRLVEFEPLQLGQYKNIDLS